MRPIDQLLAGLPAFILHLQALFPFFLQAALEITSSATNFNPPSPTAVLDFLASTIVSCTAGVPRLRSILVFLDGSTDSPSPPSPQPPSNPESNALVIATAASHPLIEAIGSWHHHWIPFELPDLFSSLPIGEVYLVILALLVCICFYTKIRQSPPLPAWLDQRRNSVYSPSPQKGQASWIPLVVDGSPREHSSACADQPGNLDEPSRVAITEFRVDSTTGSAGLPSTVAQSDGQELTLSPMTFMDPTSFSHDDPDALNPCTSLETPQAVEPTIPSDEDPLLVRPDTGLSLPAAVDEELHVSLQRCEDQDEAVTSSAGPLDLDLSDPASPVTPAPSFDLLTPLTTAPSNLRSQLLQEPLEQCIAALGTAESILSIVDNASLDDAPERGPDGSSANTHPEAVELATTVGPIVVCSLSEEDLPESDNDACEIQYSVPTDSSQRFTSSPVDATPCGDSLIPGAGQDPSVEQCLDLFPPSLTLLAPASDLNNLTEEHVSAADWTTLRCWYSMVDDEANVSSPKQTTFVRDRPTLSHLLVPALAAPAELIQPHESPSRSYPATNDTPTSKPTCHDRQSGLRARTLSGPPESIAKPSTYHNAQSTPKFSVTKFKKDVLGSEHCSLTPSEFMQRFRPTSPQLQTHFPSLLSRMGIVTHDRNYIRFLPKDELETGLLEEQRAVDLATLALQRQSTFRSMRRFSMPSLNSALYGQTSTEFLNELATVTRKTSVAHGNDFSSSPLDDAGDVEKSKPRWHLLRDDTDIDGSRSRAVTESGSLSTALSAHYCPDRRIPSWIPTPPKNDPRKRTVTSRTSVFDVDGQFEDSLSHEQTISNLVEARKANLTDPHMITDPAQSMREAVPFSSASDPHHTQATSGALQPPTTVLRPTPRRRVSSRPLPPSFTGAPKLATIIGSPSSSPPTTVLATIFPEGFASPLSDN